MKRLSLVWLPVLILSLVGCQRSKQYAADEEYYRPEPPSYYNRRGQGSQQARRIETLGQPKKRVVLLDFWNDTPIDIPALGKFSADELRRGLYLSRRLILPADAKTQLGTAFFVQGDSVKVEQLIREGRRMGVAVLVIGRVAKIVFRQKGDDVGLLRQQQSMAAVDLEIKAFDVQGGREIMAMGRSGQASSVNMVALEGRNLKSQAFRAELTKLAIRDASKKLVPDVIRTIEKMAWQGKIAKIASGKVYVNSGRASGLVGGDILKVLTPGQDVYDPSTGAYLGRGKGQLKGTLEVKDFIGDDGAVAEVHTGGNFTVGDAVQLY